MPGDGTSWHVNKTTLTADLGKTAEDSDLRSSVSDAARSHAGARHFLRAHFSLEEAQITAEREHSKKAAAIVRRHMFHLRH